MTDIRKCAQAVIDTWDEYGVTACIVHIEALRQALAAPVEPVGKKLTREELSHTDGRIEFVWWKDIPHGAFIYTTPPSVDALIGEIMDVQVWCEGNDEFLSCSYDDVVRILNRCRGQK